MISTRSVELVIDTVVCLTLAKWETVSGQFGGYLTASCQNLFRRRIRHREPADARRSARVGRGMAANGGELGRSPCGASSRTSLAHIPATAAGPAQGRRETVA